MRCITCGEQMRLALVVADETMFVPGYEHQTFECVGCRETERRLVFRPMADQMSHAPLVPQASLRGAEVPDIVETHQDHVNTQRSEVAAQDSSLGIVPDQSDGADSKAAAEARAATIVPEPAQADRPQTLPAADSLRHAGAWERAMEKVRSRRIEIARRGDQEVVAQAEPVAAPRVSPLVPRVSAPQPDATLRRPEPRPRPAPAISAAPPVVAARTAAQLRRRKSAPLASEQDEEARQRFAEFWDNLLPREAPPPPIESLTVHLAPLTLQVVPLPPLKVAPLQVVPLQIAPPQVAPPQVAPPKGAPIQVAPLPRSRSLVMVRPGGAVSPWAPATAPRRSKPARAASAKEALLRFTVDNIMWGHRH
jgi:hypothetical protein